jgi:NAD-dependent dihydropyrimidine dehydrogenase PreA subunit
VADDVMTNRPVPPEARCRPTPGRLVPVVDRNRCEAKADCVRVCPYDVFELRPLTADEKAAQSFLGRLKTIVHGGKQASVARPEDCRACGLCVTACPERAIRLVAVGNATVAAG